MRSPVWASLAAGGASLLLVGCSAGAGSCVAPEASVPSTAAPGSIVSVTIVDLWSDCNDTGQWFWQPQPQPLRQIELDLVSVSSPPATTVATASAQVAADATAVVEFEVPADATGVLYVTYEERVMGTITVTD